MVKSLPAMRETQVRSLGWEDLLEKETATHSSTLAWRIPRTEEPGRLQSMGLQRVGHDWATSLFTVYWFVLSALHPHLTRIYASGELKLCLCLLLYPQDLERELRLSRHSRNTGVSIWVNLQKKGSPDTSNVKNPPANAGDAIDAGSIPESGRSPGVGNGNPLQYSCLEKPMDRGAWKSTAHGATMS